MALFGLDRFSPRRSAGLQAWRVGRTSRSGPPASIDVVLCRVIPSAGAELGRRHGEMAEWLKGARLETALAVCDGVLQISITVAKSTSSLAAISSTRSIPVYLDRTRPLDRVTSQLRHSRRATLTQPVESLSAFDGRCIPAAALLLE